MSTMAAEQTETYSRAAPAIPFKALTTSPKQQRPLGFVTSQRQAPAMIAAWMAPKAAGLPVLASCSWRLSMVYSKQ